MVDLIPGCLPPIKKIKHAKRILKHIFKPKSKEFSTEVLNKLTKKFPEHIYEDISEENSNGINWRIILKELLELIKLFNEIDEVHIEKNPKEIPNGWNNKRPYFQSNTGRFLVLK